MNDVCDSDAHNNNLAQTTYIPCAVGPHQPLAEQHSMTKFPLCVASELS